MPPLERALQEFAEGLSALEAAGGPDAEALVLKASHVQWDDVPGAAQRFVDAVAAELRSREPARRPPVLDVLHLMAGADSDLLQEAASKVTVGLVEESARAGAAVWEVVDRWKEQPAFPDNVFRELKQLRAQLVEVLGITPAAAPAATAATPAAAAGRPPKDKAAARGWAAKLTEVNLKPWTEDQGTQGMTPEQAMDKVAGDKVRSWLAQGGTAVEPEDALAPTTALPPPRFQVDESGMPLFMHTLERRLSAVLRLAPELEDALRDSLQRITALASRVRKAGELQEFTRELRHALDCGAWRGVDAAALRSRLRRHLPAAAGEVAEAYEPEFLEGAETRVPHSSEMDPRNCLFLPPAHGQQSCRPLRPVLGPQHVLCRVWFHGGDDWAAWRPADRGRVQTLRVLLVRGDERRAARAG
eukprot:TRINITY_DN71102_c0_g1_i1.p1 TRINITY_DN71102_c0_g1~~TRINITY_DN71102_c0_g1_i1.p1  ORF type:complete len:441 (+),score=165.61 TRINITY_DN71102_c0_g1_i1:78-1325(+)